MQWLPAHVHFVVLGFGPETGDFAGAIRARSLANRVHLLDAVPQNELMSYTCDDDIGIIPIHNMCESYRYCNPGKLFEFLAAGLPLAVSNLDQLQWYVREKGLGEVFPWGSAEGIARALRRLVDDDRYRDECARNCTRVHRAEACWEIQAEKLRSAVLAG
jgi:glycosyltransferase involved in cell wall biosynthesis